MDRNTIIGLTLIFILFIVWQQFIRPAPEEQEAAQARRDSLAAVQQPDTGLRAAADTFRSASPAPADTTVTDSLRNQQMAGAFGPFAGAATGVEETHTLENDLMRVTFTNKGGRITEVLLKKHHKVVEDENRKDQKLPLKLLADEKNRFEYFLPIANLPSGGVNTADLFFETELRDSTILFRAPAGDGRYFEQSYTLRPHSYQLKYDVVLDGLNHVLAGNTENIQLTWLNYLDRIEKNTNFESRYSTIYFKPADEDPDYCSCTSDDTEELNDRPVKWIANANQFFNSSLIAEDAFSSAVLEIDVLEDDRTDLKRAESKITIPYTRGEKETFAMEMYIGPNEFDRLYAMGHGLQDIIPFGWSIFGTINRWVIRPIFTTLLNVIASPGLVILALTLIVKLLLYPLTYRMLYSQSKMGALKPQLEGLKDKFKDEPQKQQMEQMKIYREFGVNPLGGCLPMVLQMPIWIALYRFFPASIEFRQAGFLWANDLSSYDAFIKLPFEIPFGFGAHLSLFTLLWAVTTLIYTYYNTRHMDMSANPAMKYMQYLMPLFLLGFFNSFASGLTAYLLFSNLINIAQTIVTKNYIIDQEKIKKELEAYRKKPKKKGGFSQRLEAAMKEQQQKLQEQKQDQQQQRKSRKRR